MAQCAGLDGAMCPMSSGCYWNGSDCVIESQCDGQMESMCTTIGGCVWNPSMMICEPGAATGCALYTDPATCAVDPACSWDYTNIQCKAAATGCSAYTDYTACTTDAACEWNATYCQTRQATGCAAYTEYNACIFDAACEWNVSVCQDKPVATDCASMLDQITCENNLHCNWDNVNAICSGNWCSSHDQYSCNAYAACEWTGVQCDQKTSACSMFSDEPSCSLSSSCNWSPMQYCETVTYVDCATYGLESECQSNSECRWAANATCIPAVTCSTNAECQTNQYCWGEINKCDYCSIVSGDGIICNGEDPESSDFCETYMLDADCNLHAACEWIDNEYCGPRQTVTGCAAHADSSTCESDPTCDWSTSCTENWCSTNSDESACNGFAACSWFSGLGVCGENPGGCQYLMDAGSCGGNSACVWYGGICQWTCPAYATCGGDAPYCNSVFSVCMSCDDMNQTDGICCDGEATESIDCNPGSPDCGTFVDSASCESASCIWEYEGSYCHSAP